MTYSCVDADCQAEDGDRLEDLHVFEWSVACIEPQKSVGSWEVVQVEM